MDNVCKTLKHVDLYLRHDLQQIEERPLPEGYSFRFYQPGDEINCLEIESSAREFLCPEDGQYAWKQYFGGKEEELKSRMLFIVAPDGQPVATATAYYDRIDEKAGWVHWVSVRREYQGKGLSKPLILKTLSLLKEMGYPYACLHTQTSTWLAVKIYLDCGFMPWRGEEEGWRIARTLTKHEKLKDYAVMDEEDMHNPAMVDLEAQLKARYPEMEDFCIRRREVIKVGVRLKHNTVYHLLTPDENGLYRLGEIIS